jgi:DNA mismatch repair ATPase MutS
MAFSFHFAVRRCRTLFATHYHGLVDDFARDLRVAPFHMAFRFEGLGADSGGDAGSAGNGSGHLVMLYRLQVIAFDLWCGFSSCTHGCA